MLTDAIAGAHGRTGDDPAGHAVAPPAGRSAPSAPCSGAVACAVLGPGESEAVLLLVAGVVPVLPEPGARRALLRADPVRGPGRVGDRACGAIGETTFATLPVMAAALPADAARPARPLPWTRARGGRARRAAALEGAVPQRAVLPDPGGRSTSAAGRSSRSSTTAGSRGQDATGDHAVSARLRRLAGPSLIVLALTQTFAVDRLDHVAHAALVLDHLRRLLLRRLLRRVHRAAARSSRSAMRRAGLLDTVISAEHLHDIGKFLFAFTAFWAYIAFSQFFLIWYANLPEETVWFKARLRRVLADGLDPPHGRALRGAVLLPDGAARQAQRRDAGARRRLAARSCTSWISTGRSCRRSIPAACSPIGAGRGRAARRRRVLRGGGGLAAATAGARAGARPAAWPNRSRSRTSETAVRPRAGLPAAGGSV